MYVLISPDLRSKSGGLTSCKSHFHGIVLACNMMNMISMDIDRSGGNNDKNDDRFEVGNRTM